MTDQTAMPGLGSPTWVCGAFQPTPPCGMQPYRCNEPHDHTDDHLVVIDGQAVARWPRRRSR